MPRDNYCLYMLARPACLIHLLFFFTTMFFNAQKFKFKELFKTVHYKVHVSLAFCGGGETLYNTIY